MSAALKRHVPVSDIFIRGKQFHCGYCRNIYSFFTTAVQCLEKDIKEDHDDHKQMFKRDLSSQWKKACIFCLRTYKNSQETTKCVESCFQKLQEKIKHLRQIAKNLQEGVNFDSVTLQRRKPDFKANTKSPMNAITRHKLAIPTAREFTAPDIPALPSSPPEAPPPELEVQIKDNEKAPSPSASSESPGEPKKYKKPRDKTKKFIRDGARYVCAVCNEKYFTKNEVEDCYNAHPDE